MTTFIGRFSQFRAGRIQSPPKMTNQFSRNRFPHSLPMDPIPAANSPALDAPPALGTNSSLLSSSGALTISRTDVPSRRPSGSQS